MSALFDTGMNLVKANYLDLLVLFVGIVIIVLFSKYRTDLQGGESLYYQGPTGTSPRTKSHSSPNQPDPNFGAVMSIMSKLMKNETLKAAQTTLMELERQGKIRKSGNSENPVEVVTGVTLEGKEQEAVDIATKMALFQQLVKEKRLEPTGDSDQMFRPPAGTDLLGRELESANFVLTLLGQRPLTIQSGLDATETEEDEDEHGISETEEDDSCDWQPPGCGTEFNSNSNSNSNRNSNSDSTTGHIPWYRRFSI
jgi:hypothetical protein